MASKHTQYAVAESLRNEVWNELYDIERISRYYQEILKKHKRIDWLLRFVTAGLAISIALTHFLDAVLVLQVVSILVFLCSYAVEIVVASVKVNTLTQATSGCITVEDMLRELWRDIESCATDDYSVRLRLNQILKTKSVMVTNIIVKARLTEDRELNIKCAKEAKQNMINTYEGATAA